MRVVDGGRLTQQMFDIHEQAESFAEEERLRLGLPGEPPAEEPWGPPQSGQAG
ncbi:hypothetical protein [Mesorhizobium sp.]|uniref:hypothetical protein n=1 Tax=Mesorhizobium sp. TaxID=1871066 RepID=UPI0025DD4027|nr:hypothetical protein [Mesorhizobium sp.]